MESKIWHKWSYLWNGLRHREQTCGCQRGGIDWEFGISECKITTRSYCIARGTIFNIMWYIIMEKNMKKNIYIYICITESLCSKAEIKLIENQLYFSKINVLKNYSFLQVGTTAVWRTSVEEKAFPSEDEQGCNWMLTIDPFCVHSVLKCSYRLFLKHIWVLWVIDVI